MASIMSRIENATEIWKTTTDATNNGIKELFLKVSFFLQRITYINIYIGKALIKIIIKAIHFLNNTVIIGIIELMMLIMELLENAKQKTVILINVILVGIEKILQKIAEKIADEEIHEFLLG